MLSSKPIKIDIKNKDKLEAELKAVNGKSWDHAFTLYEELVECAKSAEKQLMELQIPTYLRNYAVWQETSGKSMPKAYKWPRNATWIRLVRRQTGWFLTDVQPCKVYARGGSGQLYLTKDQDIEAVQALRRRYRLLPPACDPKGQPSAA